MGVVIKLEIVEGVDPNLILESIRKMTGVESMATEAATGTLLKSDPANHKLHCDNIARIIAGFAPKFDKGMCQDAIGLYLTTVGAAAEETAGDGDRLRGVVLPPQAAPTSEGNSVS